MNSNENQCCSFTQYYYKNIDIEKVSLDAGTQTDRKFKDGTGRDMVIEAMTYKIMYNKKDRLKVEFGPICSDWGVSAGNFNDKNDKNKPQEKAPTVIGNASDTGVQETKKVYQRKSIGFGLKPFEYEDEDGTTVRYSEEEIYNQTLFLIKLVDQLYKHFICINNIKNKKSYYPVFRNKIFGCIIYRKRIAAPSSGGNGDDEEEDVINVDNFKLEDLNKQNKHRPISIYCDVNDYTVSRIPSKDFKTIAPNQKNITSLLSKKRVVSLPLIYFKDIVIENLSKSPEIKVKINKILSSQIVVHYSERNELFEQEKTGMLYYNTIGAEKVDNLQRKSDQDRDMMRLLSEEKKELEDEEKKQPTRSFSHITSNFLLSKEKSNMNTED